VDINPTHWILFGSPVYVLPVPLQGSTRIHNKRKERARLGVYLGHSHMHARSVALVLSLETGLTSPQFHIAFDPSFRTVRSDQSNQVPRSQWQKKCGFIGPKTRMEVLKNREITNNTHPINSHRQDNLHTIEEDSIQYRGTQGNPLNSPHYSDSLMQASPSNTPLCSQAGLEYTDCY
jgi:hypothetical protein